ncbi:MAG TPA: SdpI family protein [Planctomycetota bacterium]|nr:SdpI family protein [Planctomycetota bacterium]HRU50711.1 SdpI family protein [Planctomycetota bacterium]
MGYWSLMFFKVLVVPISMISWGLLAIYKPPKRIHFMLGYRTPMAKKSQETWDFAQQYAGKLCWILGRILLIIPLVPMIYVYKSSYNIIEKVGLSIMIFQALVMLFSLILTEIALRKNFDKRGRRRQTPICRDK